MKRQIFRPTPFTFLSAFVKPLIFILAAVIMALTALKQAETVSGDEGLRTLKEGLTRASVKCYAMEGMYPESLAYIEENYGIHIDRERYAVRYEVFASNILPEITVIRLD